MSSTSDVVIVGGGIIGTSIAFSLAKRGVRVTIVERKSIASGPTGRSSGNVRLHYSKPVTARMALRSFQIWQHFDDVVGGNPGFKQTGYLAGTDEEHLAALKENIALQQRVGINTRLVSPAEMKELEPQLSVTGIAGGAYEPESGYADATAAANAFAAAARRLGTEILLNTTVLSFQVAGGRATGVITNKGSLEAAAVVVACGPWTPTLLITLGIDVRITPCRVQTSFFRWPPDWEVKQVFNDLISQIYLRPEGGRQMLVGSLDPRESEDRVSDPDHFNEQVDLETETMFAEKVVFRFPGMNRGSSLGGYSSIYDVTPDWNPILDETPTIRGLFCCAGGSGHCFKMSPMIGEMMAARIIEGKRPNDDINEFSFGRFAEDEQIAGQRNTIMG